MWPRVLAILAPLRRTAWLAAAALVAAWHFASFPWREHPLATDVRHFLYFAQQTAGGALPHVDFFDNKTQLATFLGAGLYRLGASLGVDPLYAIRWGYLFPPDARPQGLVAANMIGYMANNVLPLRAGEVVRVYVVARRLSRTRGEAVGGSLWLAGATLVVERVLDSLTLVLIMACLIFLIPVPRALEVAAMAASHPAAIQARRWTASAEAAAKAAMPSLGTLPMQGSRPSSQNPQ